MSSTESVISNSPRQRDLHKLSPCSTLLPNCTLLPGIAPLPLQWRSARLSPLSSLQGSLYPTSHIIPRPASSPHSVFSKHAPSYDGPEGRGKVKDAAQGLPAISHSHSVSRQRLPWRISAQMPGSLLKQSILETDEFFLVSTVIP